MVLLTIASHNSLLCIFLVGVEKMDEIVTAVKALIKFPHY